MTARRPRVVVTRGRDRESDLAARLTAAGFDVTEVPLIATEYLVAPDAVAAALDRTRPGWVVVTSAVGAQMVVDALEDAAGLEFAAVGTATAAVLRRALPDAPISVARGREVADADALVGTVRDRVRGREVLIVVAEGGRGTVAPGLADAGAAVTELVAYRSVLPPGARASFRAALTPSPDALVFASASAARNAASVVDVATAMVPFVLCIGPHTAEAAREAGWARVEIARRQSDEGIVAALTGHLLGR